MPLTLTHADKLALREYLQVAISAINAQADTPDIDSELHDYLKMHAGKASELQARLKGK